VLFFESSFSGKDFSRINNPNSDEANFLRGIWRQLGQATFWKPYYEVAMLESNDFVKFSKLREIVPDVILRLEGHGEWIKRRQRLRPEGTDAAAMNETLDGTQGVVGDLQQLKLSPSKDEDEDEDEDDQGDNFYEDQQDDEDNHDDDDDDDDDDDNDEEDDEDDEGAIFINPP